MALFLHKSLNLDSDFLQFDELFGGSGCPAAGANGVGLCLAVEVFPPKRGIFLGNQAVLHGQGIHDVQVDVLVRFLEGDGKTEASGQAHGFLEGIAEVYFITVSLGRRLL